jgi:hypothetical protein
MEKYAALYYCPEGHNHKGFMVWSPTYDGAIEALEIFCFDKAKLIGDDEYDIESLSEEFFYENEIIYGIFEMDECGSPTSRIPMEGFEDMGSDAEMIAKAMNEAESIGDACNESKNSNRRRSI